MTVKTKIYSYMWTHYDICISTALHGTTYLLNPANRPSYREKYDRANSAFLDYLPQMFG